METERLVIRKKIGDNTYRITVITDNKNKYKIITIYGGHNVTIPHKLMELMDERYNDLRELSKKLRVIETKILTR